MSLPEEKTYRVWADVPHIVHVKAQSKGEAMLKALTETTWAPCEGYEIRADDVYDVAELDADGMPIHEGDLDA